MFSYKNEAQFWANENELSGETQIEAYVNEAYAETYICSDRRILKSHVFLNPITLYLCLTSRVSHMEYS